MTEFDLRSLLQALHEQEIEFVVIGGVAVGAHGYVRATMDLDIVPDPDPENLHRLVRLLDALGATLPTAADRPFDPSQDARVVLRGGNVTADTSHGGRMSYSSREGYRPTPNWRPMRSRPMF